MKGLALPGDWLIIWNDEYSIQQNFVVQLYLLTSVLFMFAL
jgi:hypothetical protein